MCSWLLAHHRQTAKKKDHPNLLPVLEVMLEQRTAMHRVWVASFADIYQPGVESEDNIELLPLYHVPCVTLCTLSLSRCCNNTHETTKKKEKKNCQTSVYLLYIHFGKSLWFTWIPCNEASACRVSIIKQNKQTNHKADMTQVSSFSESHPSHGRARHQIRDWSESGRSRELLMPGTMTHAGRAASSPEIFGHFWPSVWPSSRSNFDLGRSPLDSAEKTLSYQSLWFWSAVFL